MLYHELTEYYFKVFKSFTLSTSTSIQSQTFEAKNTINFVLSLTPS